MGDIAARLDEAKAQVARLEREAARATCRQLGRHTMRYIGGCNAGCHEDHCCCSVPVHECAVCGACDYGDNPEADQVRADCAEKYGDPAERFAEQQSEHAVT